MPQRRMWHLPRLGTRGVSALEFALLAPVLVGLLFGTLDVLAYFRNMSSLERTAVSMGETISRCSGVSTQDLTNFAVEAQETVGGPPFTPLIDVTGPGGAFIITAIGNDSGTAPTIVWQQRFSSAVPAYVSKIGTVGTAPANLGTFVVPKGQVLITVELYNAFTLWGIGTVYAYKGAGTGVTATPTLTTMYTVDMFLARAANPPALETVQNSSSAVCGT